jgi:hypothetical protein
LVLSGFWILGLLGLGVVSPLTKYKEFNDARGSIEALQILWAEHHVSSAKDFDNLIFAAERANNEQDASRLREVKLKFQREKALSSARGRLARNDLLGDVLLLLLPPIGLGLAFSSILWVGRGFFGRGD